MDFHFFLVTEKSWKINVETEGAPWVGALWIDVRRLSVRLSRADPESRTEGCSKLKTVGKEAHDRSDP